MNNRIINFITLSMLFALLSGCASTRSAGEMRGIQQNEGVTKELDYLGSSDSYHYFEQDVYMPGEDKTINKKQYRVPKEELTFTDVVEMPYDPPAVKKIKVKISSAPPYTLRRCKDNSEKRKEEAQRIMEYKERAKALKERMSKAITDIVGGGTSEALPSAPESTSEKGP